VWLAAPGREHSAVEAHVPLATAARSGPALPRPDLWTCLRRLLTEGLMPQLLAPDAHRNRSFDAYEARRGGGGGGVHAKSAVLFRPDGPTTGGGESRLGSGCGRPASRRTCWTCAGTDARRAPGATCPLQPAVGRPAGVPSRVRLQPRPRRSCSATFGALVALRYPREPAQRRDRGGRARVPWLGLAFPPPRWKLALGRLLPDVWPTLTLPTGIEPDHLSRDQRSARGL